MHKKIKCADAKGVARSNTLYILEVPLRIVILSFLHI